MSSSSKSRRQREDLISSVPDNVADEILGRLPIHIAATTSVLSKQWKRNWLSLKRLVFDNEFWTSQQDAAAEDCEKCGRIGNIISSILFHHDGPVQEFHFHIQEDAEYENYRNHSQWLSYLSKNFVRKIIFDNSLYNNRVPMSSYIFSCSKLSDLVLGNFALNPPPAEFKGFPYLNRLELLNIQFSKPDLFCSLIALCRRLTVLRIEDWTGMDHVVIDVPSLQSLTVNGLFATLVYKNAGSLKSISVCLQKHQKKTNASTVTALYLLSLSSNLESIHFNGLFSKILAVGGITTRVPVMFDHLKKLRLSNLDLEDISVFYYAFGMIEACPCIEELDISVATRKNADRHQGDYNRNNKLNHHLRKIKITGITGSSAELKLIEYMLTISKVLEELLFECSYLSTLAELKVTRILIGFRRASTMAQVRCLENKSTRKTNVS